MKVKTIYLYAILVILLSLTVVPSHDDFFWGTSSGYNLLKNNFDGYNGRYLGNLMIILMTRSVLFRVLLYSITSVSIPILISKILSDKIKMRYIIFLLMTIPIGIFRQTFGWFSGFANYNVSTALLLLIFYLILKKKYSLTLGAFLFILSLSTQLFVENITVVNVMLSFIACFYLFITKQKQLKLCFIWFLGSLSGMFIMFSNSAYTSDTSRSLSNTHLQDVYSHLLQDWSELLIKDNTLMIVLFSIFIYFVMNMPKKTGLFLLFFNTYFMGRKYLQITYFNQNFYTLNLELILILVFVFILFKVGFMYLDKEDRVIYLSCLIAAVLFVAPFLVTTPFGPRNILTSYILLIISLSVLFINLPELSYYKKVESGMTYLLIFISVFTLSIYSINKVYHHKRIAEFSKVTSAENNIFEMKKLPYPFLGQLLDNFENPVRLKEMKEFYGITNNVEVRMINRGKPIGWNQENN